MNIKELSSRLYARLPRLLRKRNPRPPQPMNEHTEIEKITDTLTNETVALLEKEFRKSLKDFNSKNGTMTRAEAETILKDLMSAAASRRTLLAERICHSIENGALYERFYGNMNLLTQESSKCRALQSKLEKEKKAYLEKMSILKHVSEHVIDPKFAPDYPEEDLSIEGNIWESLNLDGEEDDR